MSIRNSKMSSAMAFNYGDNNIINEFSAFEYLMIHLANSMGHDKMLFEERIQWCKENAKNLHKMVDKADNKPAFVRGLIELDNIRKGVNTGFMMGLDGTASGIQMLACLSGCTRTALNVGLIDPNKRCDIYTDAVGEMNFLLPPAKQIMLKGGSNYDGFTRNDVKDAIMPKYYGSAAKPQEIFGKGTQELAVFYSTLKRMNPGAEELMEDFLGAIEHHRHLYRCVMPDGFDIRCNVIAETTKTIEIQELPNGSGNPSTFSHIYKFIGDNPAYVATAANGTHGTDAFVVHEMHRRTNYNKDLLEKALYQCRGAQVTDRSQVPTLRLADAIVNNEGWHTTITESMAGQLVETIESVLDNKPAPLVTVHDEFKSYPSAMGFVRHNYRNICADIAESDLAQQILSGFYEMPDLAYAKQQGHEELPSLIRKSRYAIC